MRIGNVVRHLTPNCYSDSKMYTLWSAVIGWFFGFGFGVGCALAVMYSIYMGGYRAALRDTRTEPPPERLTRTLARLGR